MAYPLVRIDPRDPEWSAGRIVEFAQRFPLDAVVAADEEGVVMAAVAAIVVRAVELLPPARQRGCVHVRLFVTTRSVATMAAKAAVVHVRMA